MLAEVSKLVVAGEKIVDICAKGDKLLEQEVSKVYAKTKFKGPYSSYEMQNSQFVTGLAE